MNEGAKLGRYEIREKIGAGGMGEVYLANDEQLDRSVALKVLLPEFCSNDERVQRFKLEARAASILNHPNIITIHEVGESEDRVFIATEFVNGVTLRQKIEEGELTLQDSIEIALQLADALAVAHASHIVHRDIKPENVMIRHDGYIKILDFGLAKSILYQQPGAEDKTLQMVNTQPGLVMGSVRYMSPEQARGKDIDNRTDIWSLGVVLYEMLSGKNPFDGETVSDSIATLIHLDPPPIAGIPDDLQEVIKKSLRKNLDDRYRNVRDFALDLRDVKNRLEHGSSEQKHYLSKNPSKTVSVEKYDTSENKTLIHKTLSADVLANSTNSANISSGKKSIWRYVPLIILLTAGFLAGVMFYANYDTGGGEPRAFNSLQISRLTSDGKASLPALSPDGKLLAFINTEKGLRSLVLRNLEDNKTQQLVSPTNLMFYLPTFALDGKSVYYVVKNNAVGTLYKVSVNGGSPQEIVKDVDSRITLAPDGKKIAFIRELPEKGISTVVVADESGTTEKTVLASVDTDSSKFTDLAWSANPDEILVSSVNKVVSGNWVESKLLVLSASRGSFEQLGRRNWINPNSFVWARDGSGVYFISQNKEGEPRQIRFVSYPGGEERQISNELNGYDTMTLATEANTIVASNLDLISSIWSFDPQTKTFSQLTSESRNFQGMQGISEMPDGKLLYTIREGTKVDFWVMNADGSQHSKLIGDGGINVHPQITPDGKYIVFSSNRAGNFSLWRADIDGKNPVQLVKDTEGNALRPQILEDGKTIIYERNENNTRKVELAQVSINGENQKILTLENKTNDFIPRVSSDGKKLAFTAQFFDQANLSFSSKLNIVNLQNQNMSADTKEYNQNLGYIYEWTKDDKALTYINTLGTENVYNYSPDNNSNQQITNFNTGSILNFCWSKDGKKLYIVRAVKNSDLILIKSGEKK